MRLFNTLSKKIEDFSPLSSDLVKFFVCGPTVYDYSHLGHAKTYIQMDTLARYIRSSGMKLKYLMNITDIDDKIILRAKKNGESWKSLSTKFEKEFHQDMNSLNISSVDEYPRATDYIEQIISQVERLLTSSHAYEIPNDGIYFEISTFKGYGKLSGRKEVKENDAQSRIDESNEKKGWNDFCLWKFSKKNEPTWEAPFGSGRPGWHIEDTAITEHFFGPQYDIHGGAIDLIFPHHEAELTQMESLSSKVPFVKYWVHTGFLTIQQSKMSKSTGNFFTIREVIEKGYDPLAIRLLMLQSHYRSPLNFEWEILDAAENKLANFRAMADRRWQLTKEVGLDSTVITTAKNNIKKALSNDLNTPEAFKYLSTLETDIANSGVSFSNAELFYDFLVWLDEVFGLNLSKREDVTNEQKELILQREHARRESNWKKSDYIRTELNKQGIQVSDTGSSTTWRRI